MDVDVDEVAGNQIIQGLVDYGKEFCFILFKDVGRL